MTCRSSWPAPAAAKDFPGSPYLVAFDRTSVRVEESGLSHVDKEVLYKVLTPEGRQDPAVADLRL